MDELVILLILAFLTGVAAGYLSGLLGIGAGVLLVPASIFLLGVDFMEAKALSLFVIMCVSPVGMLRHHSHGNLHPKTGIKLGVPGVIGSLIGVYVAEMLETSILKLIFGLLLFYISFRMVNGGKNVDIDLDVNEAYKLNGKYLPAVGFFGGFMAGLLGIGGGVIMVPSLVFLSYPMHSAIANSLMVVFMNSTTATMAHAYTGDLVIMQAIPMTIGAVISVRKGADKSVSIDKQRLRKIFGYFLILMGIYMLLKAYDLI